MRVSLFFASALLAISASAVVIESNYEDWEKKVTPITDDQDSFVWGDPDRRRREEPLLRSHPTHVEQVI